MLRVIGIALWVVCISGCDRVHEYDLDAATIARFEGRAEVIAARDDERAPLAISVLASNQIGAPPGVKIWNPESTLSAVSISHGDLIALVDDEVPSRDYASSFGANQKPFGSATEQYVDFVNQLLSRRHAQPSVLLHVHHEYRTKAEREKHGGIHSKKPTRIRIIFP